jgi:hypothetical protein
MVPQENLLAVAQNDPVFHGGSFEITHFTTEAAGLAVAAKGIGRTALFEQDERLRLDDSQKKALAAAMQSEMASNGADDVRNARREWHAAIKAGAPAKEQLAAKSAFYEARFAYQNTGRKIGLRGWSIDPKNPNTLHANAISVPYRMYNLFAAPSGSKELRALSEVAGVSMVLKTSDGRLIVQHRAVKKMNIATATMQPGNKNYNDIPGASISGLIDASLKTANRRPGSPDDVTTESLIGSITKEAGEELGLDVTQFTRSRIVGIAHDNIKPHDEVLFLAETHLTAEDVRENAKKSESNKNLAEIDLDEKFFDIEASPEAVEILLANVACPLPPTHAAAFVASGFMMMLERTGSRTEAEAWAAQLEARISDNYIKMDALVASYYKRHPEAAEIVPERMWGEPEATRPPRNLSGYDPLYTPDEQGLPNLEDELVRTGLLAETRRKVSAVKIFDIDGVIINPTTKEVTDPVIFDEFIACLRRGEMVALNTGRSLAWIEDRVINTLLSKVGDVSLLGNFMAVGEKGGAWLTFDEAGQPVRGRAPELAIPEELKHSAKALVAERFANSMFFDVTKETMLSVEMLDGHTIEDFKPQQHELALELRKLLHKHGLDTRFRIDQTTIATDVESPFSGKALGVDRFIEFMRSRNIAFKDASFTTFGDSNSDVAMAEELARRGLDTTFVFVGDPTKLPPNTEDFHLVTLPGYETATARYLQEN